MAKLPYINLGCGYTYHNDWTNVDFISTGENVKGHNLLGGIPFDDGMFEVAYHSHVLEHFSKKDAQKFIKECNRILKKGGVLRIAVPDLEAIARNYIKYLEEALSNVPGADEKYNWTLLEMYDQTVRNQGGGGMIEYISEVSRNNDDFLIARNGAETRELIQNVRKATYHTSSKPGMKARIKQKLIKMLLKSDTEALRIGQFRLGGEIHQWMYDRYSLAKLLEQNGFIDAKVMKADESKINNWNSFGLDMKNGEIRKPDSLFMEAVKA